MAKKKAAQQPIGQVLPAVDIEYDTAKGRATKQFADAHDAKRFYAAKMKADQNPKVLAGTLPAEQPEPKQPKAAAAEQPAAEPAKPKTPGVSWTRTRYFVAGEIIKRHGHEAGVTEAMVAELDAEYGKPNPVESMIALKNTWHALRGWAAIAQA